MMVTNFIIPAGIEKIFSQKDFKRRQFLANGRNYRRKSKAYLVVVRVTRVR